MRQSNDERIVKPVRRAERYTTGLDPINTARIRELILSIRAKLGLTSLVVTHDMDTAFAVSNRVVMLADGKVRMQGTPDEFRATSDPYHRRQKRPRKRTLRFVVVDVVNATFDGIDGSLALQDWIARGPPSSEGR
jgi:ABC-type multidrug transport system ATPase subunit